MEEQQTFTPSNNSPSDNGKTMTAIGAVVAVAAVGAIVYQGLNKKAPTQPTAPTTPTTNTGSTAPAGETQTVEPATSGMAEGENKTYKDGEYTATGHYVSPNGPEEIIVTLTLKDNKVADAVMEPTATNQYSIKWQGVFHDNFKPLVIGKDINTLKLDKVSGSSLAPKGFNDAVEQIKVQAS